jgi:GR25 family glycosyltransferase involved in LPS biosynthesis
MNLEIDHIYICHWNKLIERKEHIIKELNFHKISNFSFVEIYDKDNLDINEITKEYPKLFKLTDRDKRYLKLSEISLLLKHCWIVKDAKLKKYKSIMILEDDVVFDKNFVELFNRYKKQLPEDWDCCWVGSCCNIHTPSTKNINVYPAKTSRCCHCYILSENCINKILDEIININEGIDWYYNDLIKKLNLNAFWFEPSLAEQSGNFSTTVQN